MGGDENRMDGLWRDDPISTVEQDQLGRTKFARHAAQLIDESHSSESSLVYGLEGPWGSGKSSAVNMTIEYLRLRSPSKWDVVKFTPWATSGTEGLLAEFFSALASVAPVAQRRAGLRKTVEDYADIVRPIAAVIPVLGPGVVEASRAAEQRLRKPWDQAFQEVSGELQKLGKAILVVVDDIDRLQSSELLELLKVVRLLGRFPGVDFLLAYDEQTLVDTLQTPARGRVSVDRARQFMEKIVQYPLVLPPLLTSKVIGLLDAGLGRILGADRIDESFDKRRFGNALHFWIPARINTPRAIDRFLGQVQEQFRVHERFEIDDADVILSTFLRLQFPDVFNSLQGWKSDLTNQSGGTLFLTRQDSVELPNWDDRLSFIDDLEARKVAFEVLRLLFPAVSEKRPGLARAGRFAHPEYFDRYLSQSIPDGDLPDAAVARALDSACQGSPTELNGLVLASDIEVVKLAIGKISSRYANLSQPWLRDRAPEGPISVELFEAGMSLVDQLDEDRSSLTSPLSGVMAWMEDLLGLVLDSDPEADVDTALSRCSNLDRRASIVAGAQCDGGGIKEATSQALRAVFAREVDRMLPILLSDLRAGDLAVGDSGSSYLYGLIDKAGRLPDLKVAIRGGIDAGDFTAEDVAARLVGLAYLVGGAPGESPSSASFDGEMFTKLTDIPAASVSRSALHRPSGESWTARRIFASQYITQDEDSGGMGSVDR